MKFLVSGYYGFGNLGDEAILSVLTEELRERFPQVEVVILSAKPEETAKQYRVRAINRWNLRSIGRELQSATAFISGGGGLIQDQTSRRSAFYYLSLIALARRRCPVYVIGQGIGPIRSRWVRAGSGLQLRQVELALVRDEMSYAILQGWGLPEERLLLGGDLTLLLQSKCNSLRDAPFRARDHEPYFAVCLKGRLSEGLKRSLAQQLDRLGEQQSVEITFIAFYPREDLRDMEEIASRMKQSTRVLNSAELGLKGVIQCMSGAQAIVGMRLHALIFSLLTARPFVAFADDLKIEAFLKQIEKAGGPKTPYLLPTSQGTPHCGLAQSLVQLACDSAVHREQLMHAKDALVHRTRQAMDAAWQRLSRQIAAGGSRS